MKTRSFGAQRRQSGFTLMMTLIFLVIFMLFAISMVSSSVVSTRVASNQQYRMEAKSVAQEGAETILNQPFTLNPITTVTSVPIDVTGSGKPAFTAQVAVPVCLSTKPVLNQDLDLSNASDRTCMISGASQNTGLLTSPPTPNYLCVSTNWEVQSSVTDPNNTATSVVVHQGVSVRVPIGTACP
ncbi:type IV pilus modification PilV family protein [Dyella subtropica]|uniref:type IV pilus modification PilV family protein n=1 Tax=Dyella subtropica TaxID=2992127 RepID=UPI002254D650|nr:PilX N-terminal domain-containing pilus assembly protein [Dyella subtropica]